MESLDKEMSKFKTKFKFGKKFTKSSNLICNKPISNEHSPVSFLEKLTPIGDNSNSIVEEIFHEENSKFYNRFQDYLSSSPSRTPVKLETSYTESYTKPSHKKTSMLPKKLPQIKPNFHTNTNLKSHSLARRRNQYKVESILKECNETYRTFSEQSCKFNSLMTKERKIARNYSKDLQWTSKKLLQIDGYSNEIMKALYEEHKNSYDLYETEKNIMSKKYNHKTLAEFKKKARHIKNLLITFKNKVIP